jgi:hypothetical protein
MRLVQERSSSSFRLARPEVQSCRSIKERVTLDEVSIAVPRLWFVHPRQAIITVAAGVSGVMPNRTRFRRDVWVWRGAFAFIALGTLLRIIGTALSP